MEACLRPPYSGWHGASYVFLTSQYCRDLERDFAVKAALLIVRVNALAFAPHSTGNLCPDCDFRFVLSIRAPCHRATKLSCLSLLSHHLVLTHHFYWGAIAVLVLD